MVGLLISRVLFPSLRISPAGYKHFSNALGPSHVVGWPYAGKFLLWMFQAARQGGAHRNATRCHERLCRDKLPAKRPGHDGTLNLRFARL